MHVCGLDSPRGRELEGCRGLLGKLDVAADGTRKWTVSIGSDMIKVKEDKVWHKPRAMKL